MLTKNPITYLQDQLAQLTLVDVLRVAIPTVIALFLAVLTLKLLEAYRLLKQQVTYLKLTPPAFNDKTPLATEQLFSVLHGLEATRTLTDKLLRRKVVLSLEVVSSRDAGIRFIICVPKADEALLQQNIASYLPDVRIKKTKDYLPASLKTARVVEFKQTGHFAYPLQDHASLELHDPIAYLTGVMTKLEPSELIVFQIVLSPAKVAEAHRINKKILANKDARSRLSKSYHPLNFMYFLSTIIRLPLIVIGGILHAIFWDYDTGSKGVVMSVAPTSQAEQDLVNSIHNKLKQPLFRVSIRALVVSGAQSKKQKTKGLRTSLTSFTVPKYQSLQARRNWTPLLTRYRLFSLKNRLPSLYASNSCVLSASEVSSLYHFPHSVSGKTENVVKSLSKTLPAPVSLKNGSKIGILIGENHHHGSVTPIGLTQAERERHMYIIGGTGNGKTTMLLYSIVQDIQNGNGVAVLDPHGDLAETILRHIPKERINDVIYLNPDDLTHPIGINLLELPDGLTGDELLREKDLVTESTISVLRKIFSDDDSGGHRIEYILRNTIQTALTLQGTNLFTIFRLLNDAKYRTSVVRDLEDEDLKNFWKNEMGKAGDFQRVKMSAGITAKIGRFLFSASAKRILEQEKSTIDFSDILDSKKILICNFSKGLLGEDTSTLFGTTILAKIQVAALRRARTKQANREPYFLYVDEFQNFATMSFVQMLSEARKYKLFLTMAEQSTSQQDEQRLVDIILANVGTVVAFRSGSPADERLILPLFTPFINEGEIANLPAYNFYVRIAAVDPQEPMSGITVLLDNDGSENTANDVVELSRRTYGRIKLVEDKTEAQAPQRAAQQRSTKAKGVKPSKNVA